MKHQRTIHGFTSNVTFLRQLDVNADYFSHKQIINFSIENYLTNEILGGIKLN